MNTYVINLIGAPGVGKSTIAAELFAELKKRNVAVEMTIEFAKELVYTNDERIRDQLFVLAEQYNRLHIFNEKVQFIITDSPVLLSIIYNKINGSYPDIEFSTIVWEVHNKFKNINFLLERNFAYAFDGSRIENEEQSNKVQNEIKALFEEKLMKVHEVKNEDRAQQILNILISEKLIPDYQESQKDLQAVGDSKYFQISDFIEKIKL